MKNNLILLIVLFFSAVFYSQTKGIAYQAVIYNPNGRNLPGVTTAVFPLSNSTVCLRFNFFDGAGDLEYKEQITTKTDQFGIVNLVIGTGNIIGGYAGSFSNIKWDTTKMDMSVELDITGECSTFIEISKEPFTTAPFSFSALTANNVTGIVALANGGTGSDNSVGARNNLGIGNVDNTSDKDKPVSDATAIALDNKLDKILVKPETILTTDTNTLAIKGLKNETSTTNQLLSINPTTGILSRTAASNTLVIHELVYTASANETKFTTPLAFTDINKINVYRNGIRIGISIVDSTHIELEKGLICNDNDEIRIVQYE